MKTTTAILLAAISFTAQSEVVTLELESGKYDNSLGEIPIAGKCGIGYPPESALRPITKVDIINGVEAYGTGSIVDGKEYIDCVYCKIMSFRMNGTTGKNYIDCNLTR